MEKNSGYPSIDKPWLKYYDRIHTETEIPQKSIFEYIWEQNKDRLNETMISYLGHNFSVSYVFGRIHSLAYAFQERGLNKGDVVTLMSLITPETIYCIYALNYLGVIINSVYYSMSDLELIDTIAQTSSKFLISLDLANDKINRVKDQLNVKGILILSIADSFPMIKKMGFKLFKKIPRVNGTNISYYHSFVKRYKNRHIEGATVTGDTPAFIVYTSGSTGSPKGVVLSNKNINSTAIQYGVAGFDLKDGDKFLTFIPLFLSIGISYGMNAALAMRMQLDVFPDPTPDAVTKHYMQIKPNHFCGDPHNALLICNSIKQNVPWIKNLGAGGASPTKEQEEYMNEILKKYNANSKLLTGYGMTELSSGVISTSNHAYKFGSIGIPLPLNNIRITDLDTQKELTYNEVGELWIYSPGQTSGYYHNPEANKDLFGIDEHGKQWIRTGDLALIDEDGFLFFKGRLKRIYLKQGKDGTPYKIFPQRVEDLLLSLPMISECGVVVKEDDIYQHIQIAYVTVNDFVNNSDVVQNLTDYLKSNLPDFMVPEKIIVIDCIPRLANGKVDYKELENMSY